MPQHDDMQQHWKQSHLSAQAQAYLDSLYESYLVSPDSVPEHWVEYFDALPAISLTADAAATTSEQERPHTPIINQFEKLGLLSRSLQTHVGSQNLASDIKQAQQVRISKLIEAYRRAGHLIADIDPLKLIVRDSPDDLKPSYHNLSEQDFAETFSTAETDFAEQSMTLQQLLDALQYTYSSTMGVEYMHINVLEERRWLQHELESVQAHPALSQAEKIHIYKRLTAAEGLETYLASRYPGMKRFGLEGGESLVPMVDTMIQKLGIDGVKEIVIGMAHRGRLNLLINIFGKKPADLFDEFEGKVQASQGSGDVKYHQGFSTNVSTAGGDVHLAMAFNPSHLEIVNPVVQGSVRARQDRRNDAQGDAVVPIIIHGDAAFSGQGVVMETMQMYRLRGYGVGGSLHIVVNNQIGFTISDKLDSRSTRYCTAVAKMLNAPVIHVNGDDPEMVVFAAQLAVRYRNKFHKDVVIDMYCYRRRGHNEADEPMATQPRMYTTIQKKDSTASLYSKKLIAENVLNPEEDASIKNQYRNKLETGQHVADALVGTPNTSLHVDWSQYLNQPWVDEANTNVDLETIQRLGTAIFTVPEGFTLQRQVKKLMDDRLAMLTGDVPLNWGAAELLAYATLLHEGYNLRISGQDARRGTFAHRHAYVYDQATYATHFLLQAAIPEKGYGEIYDSFLSEEAVLGFEYGYVTTSPSTLTIWEAQFGDFANGAQVVIDQFITSGETKWQRLCNLVTLLPHGYEGQGPEHSSARLERFVQLCAENNIQLCVPTTAAQIFHLLRRQMVRNIRKPLVVMTPKSLLRRKEASSSLEDITEDSFHTIITTIASGATPKSIRRIVLCSGKVYYDLLDHQNSKERFDTLLVRIEQIYPFPSATLEQLFKQYAKATTFVWCQEEPRNQGMWYNGQHWIKNALRKVYGHEQLHFAGRAISAAPAVGLPSVHAQQQKQLVEESFADFA